MSDEPADEEARDADDEPEDAAFDALWSRVLEAWDDEKPHQAALSYALDKQLLPVIAGRYRKLKEEDPGKAERAQKKIDGIVVAATQLMLAMKTPAREKVPWQWTASAAFMFVVVMSLLLYKLLIPHH